MESISFKFKRKTVDPDTGKVEAEDTEIEAPLLTILPVPFIRIKDMTIHFKFIIKTTDFDETQRSFSANLTTKAGWGWGNVKLTASYGYKRETRSQADRSAELDIVVNAVQDEMPEGLRRESMAPAK